MEKYFNLPHIGELLLEHTFYTFDDEPILFVCKDRTGLRYLCSCCRLYEEWVIGQISESALIDLIDDKVTIRATFKNSCDPQFFVIWDGKQFSLNFDFSDNLLPKVGALLELEREKSGSYRKTLENDIRLQSMLEANIVLSPFRQENNATVSYVLNYAPSITPVLIESAFYMPAFQTYQREILVNTTICYQTDFGESCGQVIEAEPLQRKNALSRSKEQAIEYEKVSQCDRFDYFAA